MVAKKWLSFLPVILGIILVVALLSYLVLRDHPNLEGFASPVLSTPKCPDNYTFFNDKRGDSFCCQGEVDRYNHTCKARGDKQMCSMKPDMKDPRTNVSGGGWSDIVEGEGPSSYEYVDVSQYPNVGGMYLKDTDMESVKKICEREPECKAILEFKDREPSGLMRTLYALLMDPPKQYGKNYKNLYRSVTKLENKPFTSSNRKLPLCSDMIQKSHSQSQAQCPRSLSNYASVGKCCLTQADLDGYDCRGPDNADKKRYCRLVGPLTPGEQLCSNLNMGEQAAGSCPSGFAQMTYPLGDREVQKYGSAASGINIPVCFGMDKTCIPDQVIQQLQSRGIYTDKKVDTWAYSCKGWKTANVDRDLTKKLDTVYM